MKKIIFILITQVFLFTSLALPESGANYCNLRPNVGISAERMQGMMTGPVELLVLDDEEMQRDVLTQALSASNVKKINAAGSIEEGLESLRDNPGINFLVVDFRLGNHEADREDNGVKFCYRAVNEIGFKGRIVILSADDSAVIRELRKYPELFEEYTRSIFFENKSNPDAYENIKKILRSEFGFQDTSSPEPVNVMPKSLVRVQIGPGEIGISQDIVDKYSNKHVVIVDDDEDVSDIFALNLEPFFRNIHKTGSVEGALSIIKELRSRDIPVPDTEIIVLSDYEFGTEQTGKRAKDGYDFLMALRLQESMDFKGFFTFVSGSIVSKHEIEGYDPVKKDISEDIKRAYGFDYIEKSADTELLKNLLRLVYTRLEAPYDLRQPITKPLARRPLSQPVDITFLNGKVNDFEFNLVSIIRALTESLDSLKISIEAKERLKGYFQKMKIRAQFGNVDKGRGFNERAHKYKGRLGNIAAFFIPASRQYIDTLDNQSKQELQAMLENFDYLLLCIKRATDYTKRLLDLSSVVGNIGRPISFEDLKKISLGAFSQEYGNRINLKIDTDESQFKETEFPYALTFIMSYILENAVEQYALKFGKEFKGNIFVAIGKDTASGEPVIDINIQDEAGGIAERLLPNGLFRRKVRDEEKQGGTGYGLFWAKELIEMFGGSISAGNKDKGAFFNVRLPVDWKSKFDVNGRVNKLEARIAEILTKRQMEDVENISAKIAKEIEDYSSMLAGIAERREVNVSKRGSEIKRDMPNYLASLNIEVGAHKLIIEQGVTKEDIQNGFLFLLTLGSVEEVEAVKAPFLADRQLVRILDEGKPALLLRTKGNVYRENEPITPEEREDYQKTLRFLGYSIHKLAGGGLALVRVFLQEYKELSEEARDEIMQEFNQHDPVDMLGSVHYLTDSEGQLTGFENNRVIIERVSGWKGVIRQLVENASRVPQEAKRRLDLIDPEAFKRERRFTRHMNEFIKDGHDLAAILNNEPIRNKRWINEYLASYPYEGSRLKNVEHFNLNAAPGTRLWLKEFFLDNIMLNVFRLTVGEKNYGEDLYVDVSEQEGSTVFNARYKGDVNIDTAFKVKADNKEPWYNGPLLLWLIKAMDGKIEITKDSENVNIRISFPLSSEAMESPASQIIGPSKTETSI